MRRIHDVAARDGQFVIATHSPILLALPGARIYELTAEGAQETDFDSAEPVRLTRSFLQAPDRFLHHLLTNDPDCGPPRNEPNRTAERRVGKECVSECRDRGEQDH